MQGGYRGHQRRSHPWRRIDSSIQTVQIHQMGNRDASTCQERVLNTFRVVGPQNQSDAFHPARSATVKSYSANVMFNRTRFDIHARTFTPSQQKLSALLLDWVERPRQMLLLISGGPGTGKTYAVRGLVDTFHVDILRMAYTARIAQNIGGRTIHSCLKLDYSPGSVLKRLEEQLSTLDIEEGIQKSEILKQEFSCFQYPLVVMIDEIAMIPYFLMYWIIRFFFDRTKKPLLVIGLGDGHQLLPVGSTHNLFGMQCLESQFETHRIEFTQSKRFSPTYEPVIERLRRFVDANDETGMFTYLCATYPVKQDIQKDILKICTRVLAFRNATVDNYNSFYIEKMIQGKKMRICRYDSMTNEVFREDCVYLKPECEIFVTQNGFSEVANGTLLTFKKYCPKRDILECLTVERDQQIVCVRRNRMGSFPITVGFASTVHKFQGQTIDDKAIAINFDGSQDLNLVYTALSRVRSMDQIKAVKL